MDEKLIAKARLIYERDNNSPLFLLVADYYLKNNDLQNALTILEKGLKIYPDHPLAHTLMGKVQHALHNIDLAEFYFKKSSELLSDIRTFTHYKEEYKLPNKQTSPFDSSRGNLFIDLLGGDLLSDKVVTDDSKSVDERLSEIAQELINRRIDRNEDPAFKEFNRQEYYPDKSSLATETFANIYLSQGQKSEAIRVYQLLISRNPDKKDYYLDKIREIQSQ